MFSNSSNGIASAAHRKRTLQSADGQRAGGQVGWRGTAGWRAPCGGATRGTWQPPSTPRAPTVPHMPAAQPSHPPVLIKHIHQRDKAVGGLPVGRREHWNPAQRQRVLGVRQRNVVGCWVGWGGVGAGVDVESMRRVVPEW